MPTELMKIKELGFVESIGVSILGFAIVFLVLVALMYMIQILRAYMEKRESGKAAAAPVPAMAAAAPAAPFNMIPAKGSLGEVKLHDVEDKTAAMVMAIVANEMDAPLNELRFISIREKK